MMLARPQTTDEQGRSLVSIWSIPVILDAVEVDQYSTSRILTGINPDEFCWNLAPQATFQTHEAF